jgi:tRNA(fMet)-specific endonuclease VapC
MQRSGLSLAPMDILIAAHALATGAVLVTSDQAFHKAAHLLKLEDWI